MAANFKMVFDFYGAVHSAKKQGMHNFLSPKCCLTLYEEEEEEWQRKPFLG